jgi:hypothetical protein
MRTATFVVAASLAAAALAAGTVPADDGYRHGRIRIVEPGVTVQRATEASAEEAAVNEPFLPGDRVWTDGYGRAEFQFPDGSTVRLDARSKLDYAGHEEEREERIVLRLWSGSLIVRVHTRNAGHFEIETPAGMLEALDQAMLRVDVDEGETRISTYRGEAILDDGRNQLRIDQGERTIARWGAEPETPQAFDVGEQDDFSRWDIDRDSEEDRAARSSEYLPRELDPYAGELQANGNWGYESGVGYVWTPRVAAGWSPYSNGYWSWTPYGWTWIPNESWGWAPFHYGRWGFSVSLGWYWAPGSVWGPAWVSWGVGNGYVGWCPLGRNNRPVYAWGGQYRGYAVPRYGSGGWSVVRDGDFGRRNVAQRRVPLTGIDPRALRVADSPSWRPSRDARSLMAGTPEAHAISRRPTPGDFVRELSVDNRTTIPAPWLRRGRTREDGANTRANDLAASAQARRDATRNGSSVRPERAPDSQAQQRWAQPRASSSTQRYVPRTREDSAAERSDAVRREPQRSSGDDSARPAPAPRRDTGSYSRPAAERGAQQRAEPRRREESSRQSSRPPRESSPARGGHAEGRSSRSGDSHHASRPPRDH